MKDNNTVLCIRLDFNRPSSSMRNNYSPDHLCAHSSLTFTCPGNKKIDISVYTSANQFVKRIVCDFFKPGVYYFVWDGTDEHGRLIDYGTFSIHCRCESRIQTQKIIRLFQEAKT